MHPHKPRRSFHLTLSLPCSDAGMARLRGAMEALDRPPELRVRLEADDWLGPGTLPASDTDRALRYTLTMAGRELPLTGRLQWPSRQGEADTAVADHALLSLFTHPDCLPVALHGAQHRVDDWDFHVYRRHIVEPLAARLGASACVESLWDDPDLPVVDGPGIGPGAGHQRYVYDHAPTRFYDLRKPARYFVLETDEPLSAALCRRVSALVQAGGLCGLDEHVSTGLRTYTFEDILEQGLLTFGVDLQAQGSLADMVARGRVLLAFYLARPEADDLTEASLVRVLLYAAPGGTRIHVTPESCHVHGVPITGAPWSGCDWDFRLYRDGPVRALIQGLPARLVRETELGWPADADARQLDAYEHPDDEPYWPRYRARIYLGFAGELGPDALR